MAGKKARNNANKTRSKVTGKKFNRQDPNGRRHGPQSKRKVYAMAIEQVLDSHWGDEWLTSSEIAYMANKDVSNFRVIFFLSNVLTWCCCWCCCCCLHSFEIDC